MTGARRISCKACLSGDRLSINDTDDTEDTEDTEETSRVFGARAS